MVAALTIPNLITNYQKQQTANQLKKSYSTISQALTTSVSENGDFSEWGIMTQEADWDRYQEKLSALVKQNIIPYLNVVKDCEFSKCPNTKGIKIFSNNGEAKIQKLDSTEYLIYLADGSRIVFFIDNYNNTSDGKNYWRDLWVIMDINGDKNPNELGKDVFYMVFKSSTQKINMYDTDHSRETLLNECKNSYRRYCGALIQKDGWEIPDDYPW